MSTARDLAAMERALVGARVLYLESPTSWVFEVQDVARLSAIARREGAVTIIDNSWASPIFQRPLAHGADLVVHSASKYLSGHSDTVAGVVAGSAGADRQTSTAIVLPYLGAKLAPFEGWLLVRGMRTLDVCACGRTRRARSRSPRLRGHPRVDAGAPSRRSTALSTACSSPAAPACSASSSTAASTSSASATACACSSWA